MNDKDDRVETACLLLLEFYQNVDEIFLGYFISISAPRTWRQKLDAYIQEYKHLWVAEIGLGNEDAEKRVEEADHMFGDGEFRLYTTTSKLRKILAPGVFEDLQAKNAVKLIYDSWDNTYRPQLEKLVGQKVQGDIWGDLRYLRHSIAHRDSRGVEDIKKAKLIKNFTPNQKITLTKGIMAKIQFEIENWHAEFQLKYRTTLKRGDVICRIEIPSGRGRTFGLSCLKRYLQRQKFGFGFLSKESSDLNDLIKESHD